MRVDYSTAQGKHVFSYMVLYDASAYNLRVTYKVL